jgi:hypothetical protein
MLNHELFRRLNGVFRNILPKDNQNTLIRITGRSSWSLARSNLFLPYLWEYGAKLNTYIDILFPIQPNHDFSAFTGKTYSTMEYFVYYLITLHCEYIDCQKYNFSRCNVFHALPVPFGHLIIVPSTADKGPYI